MKTNIRKLVFTTLPTVLVCLAWIITSLKTPILLSSHQKSKSYMHFGNDNFLYMAFTFYRKLRAVSWLRNVQKMEPFGKSYNFFLQGASSQFRNSFCFHLEYFINYLFVCVKYGLTATSFLSGTPAYYVICINQYLEWRIQWY